MPKIILLVSLCFLMTFPIKAQDDYQLRVPDADEYLRLIPQLAESPDKEGMLRQFDLIEREFQFRYADLSQLPSNLLIEAYSAIVNASDYNHRPWHKDYWNRAIILSWLRENKIDLSQKHELNFSTYDIDIDPRDFNGDGKDEYLLHVKRQGIDDRLNYEDYVVIHQTDSRAYEIIPSPLPWLGDVPAYYADEAGELSELLFKDINNDGLPEWVLEHAASNTGMGSGDRRKLYVLTWRDGQLVNLTPTEGPELLASGNEYTTSTWEFKNVDDDSELEILKDRALDDNWGCHFIQQSIFDWNKETYVFTKNVLTFENSAGCAWRKAEEAMWDHDYNAAIPHYEDALVKQPLDDEDSAEIRQYIQFRLIVAFALTNQADKAQKMIDSLAKVKPATSDIGQLISNIKESYTIQNKIALCTSAFNFFRQYSVTSNYTYVGPISRPLGATYVDSQLFFQNTSPADPAKAGCDIRSLIESSLKSQYPVETPPDEQLKAKGIEIARSFSFDFNHDGQKEWLIWTKAQIGTILFVPNGDYYTVSKPEFNYLSLLPSQITTQTLPGSEANVLIILTYYPKSEGDFQPGACPNNVSPLGDIQLQTFDSGEFQDLASGVLCEELPLDAILQDNGKTLHIWTSLEPYIYEPGILTWDQQKQDYELTSVSGKPYKPEDYADPSLDNTHQPRSIAEAVSSSLYYFPENRDRLSEVVDELKVSLSKPSNSQEALEGGYFRALVLEALNRPSEALAQYVDVYESSPASSWGKLAALHMKMLEPH